MTTPPAAQTGAEPNRSAKQFATLLVTATDKAQQVITSPALRGP